MDKLAPFIRDHGISFPVIFPGFGWDTPQAKEWGIRGIPSSFLISPDGVVVATDLEPEQLGEALDAYLRLGGRSAAVFPMSARHTLEGKRIAVDVQYSNPLSAETKYKFEITFPLPQQDESGEVGKVDNKTETREGTVAPGNGWDMAESFSFEVPEGCPYMYYSFSIWNPQIEQWVSISDYAFEDKGS